MLMLLFQLGDSRYAVPAREVVEVAPLVELEPLPGTPEWVAGLFNYRGRHVPVLDLCRLIGTRKCSDRLTSRMILVDFPLSGGGRRTLGLLAEQVTETLPLDEEAFSGTGIALKDTPCIGEAAHTAQGLIHRLSVAELLPADVQARLYPAGTG